MQYRVIQDEIVAGAGRQAGKTTRDDVERALLMGEVLQVPADPEIRRGLDEAAREAPLLEASRDEHQHSVDSGAVGSGGS